MTTNHTPEPWQIKAGSHKNPDDGAFYVRCSNGKRIAVLDTKSSGMDLANSSRIVQCVNALAGLNPEAIKDVVEALDGLLDNYKENSGKGLGIGPLSKARTALAKLKQP